MRLLTLALATCLALCVGAFAHPSGTSKIVVRVFPNDSVTVLIDVNATDAAGSLNNPLSFFEPYDADKVKAYQDRVAQYMYTRLRVAADNRTFLNPNPVLWDSSGKPGNYPWDSLTAFDPNHFVTFAGTMRVRSDDAPRILTITTQLFPEFEVQTLSEISVFWRDSLMDRKWIGLDKVYRIHASPESLDARYARLLNPGTDAAGDNLFLRFIPVGFVHILPYGLDHILFVIALFLFSVRLRPLLLQVTAFTLAHSITLGLALLGIFSLPPAIVEPLIALSIAVVGIENVFFRKARTSRWAVVFVFGLIHGMGFAGVLKDFGFPPGGFWQALFGFNVGVELGQLTVIAGAFLLTVFWRNKPWYFARVVVPISLAISAVGLFWAFQRILGF